MPVYMFQFAYTTDAWDALAKNPQDRGLAFNELVQNLGGQLISFYYCFGEYDGVAIYEVPDDATAAAVGIAALAPGHNKATKTTRLLTVEEMLAALHRAGGTPYSRPRGPMTPAPG